MPFCPKRKPQPSTITRRQLLKLEAQAELDALELEVHRQELELHRQEHNLLSLWFENFKATHYAVVSNKEKEKDIEDDLEDTQEEVIVEADKGEMLLFESKWDDSEEDNKVNFNLPPKFDEKEEEPKEVLKEEKEEVTLEANEEEVELHSKETQEEIFIHAEKEEQLELTSTGSKYLSLIPTPTQKIPFGETPIPSPNDTLAISLPPHIFFLILEPPYVPDEPACPSLNHPVVNSQIHPIRTKQALFVWLILFQPLTLFIPTSLLPFVFFSKPLINKFCHKDKWKERTLVL